MSEQTGQPLSDAERQKIDMAFALLGEQDYYEILDLERSAEASEVKRAYYRVSKSFHPDRYFRRPLGNYKDKLEALFDLQTKAYNTLSDGARRSKYDKDHPPKVKVAPTPPPTRRSAASIRGVTPGAQGGAASGPTPPRIPRPQHMPPPRPLFQSALTKQLIERQKKARKYLDQGRTAAEAGRFEEALASLQLAASFDPRSKEAKALMERCRAEVADTRAEMHYQKGLHNEMLGATDVAKRLFQMAVDCKPKKGYYYAKLASVLTDESELRPRLEALKLANQHDEGNLETLLKLAAAYELAGMPRNALREFEKVLEKKKGHDEAEKAVRRLKTAI